MAPRPSAGTAAPNSPQPPSGDLALVCPDCGHEDDAGPFHRLTDGRRVLYRHTCPRCETVHTRPVGLR